MIALDKSGSKLWARTTLLAVVVFAALVGSFDEARAQIGFFEALFGRRAPGPSASAYADPSHWNPFGSRNPETPRIDSGGSAGFCVRLCDGRYFPIPRNMGVPTTQTCNSFCPATATKVYYGGSIEHAVAADGKRYAELGSAFVYREKIIANCTCNGKDAFGLVNPPVDDDATLRPGDIVATRDGLMAYNGGRKQNAQFTPIESYSGLSPELRRKLTETKIEPVAPVPAPPPISQADSSAVKRSTKTKRVQLSR